MNQTSNVRYIINLTHCQNAAGSEGCGSTKPIAKDCKVRIKCSECESDKHTSAMHPGRAPWPLGTPAAANAQSGEPEEHPSPDVTSMCTEICGGAPKPRSCSKVCLVNVYQIHNPNISYRVYVVLDHQCNRSLAKSQLFDLFNINGSTAPYTLRACTGIVETAGRRASQIVVESLDGKTRVALPTLLECNNLPDDRSEIPS